MDVNTKIREGEAPFYVKLDDDNDVHEVIINEEDEFYCNDCEANGYMDGYTSDEAGAEEWHNDL
jgi:hypothetical protein